MEHLSLNWIFVYPESAEKGNFSPNFDQMSFQIFANYFQIWLKIW